MATNYYEMGRGLGGAWFEGKERGRQIQRQEERDAREKTLQERQDEEYARQQAQRAEEDAAVQQFGALNRVGKRNDAAIRANDADFDKAVEATGLGRPMPAAAPMQQEYTPATALDRNQGLQGIMRARRDWGGVSTLQKEEPELLWKQEFGRHLKEYQGSPEQIEEGIRHINSNSRTLTLGTPDKNGFARFSIAAPDGQALFGKLSRQDQAQLYAAGQLMQQDPARALAAMGDINKDLAAAIAADNNMTKFLGENANDVAIKSNQVRNDNQRTANDGARVGIARAAAARQADQERLGKLLPMEGPDGKATFGEAVLVNGVPTLRPVDMGGLRVPGKPVDQKAVVDTAIKLVESGFPNPNAPKEPLDMPTALAIAAAQLSGRPYVSEQQKLIDAYTAAKTAGPPANTQQTAPTAPQGRGLFTDRQGQTQLLEPLTRFGEFNRRLQDETNQNLGY